MTGTLWAALGFLVALSMTAIGDMASEEIRDRLDHLPHAILHLAARRLAPRQRITIYQDEWLPELTYILKGAEVRPITRLIIGIRYALGILIAAPRIARRLDRKLEGIPIKAAYKVEDRGDGYLILLNSPSGAGKPGSSLTLSGSDILANVIPQRPGLEGLSNLGSTE